MRQILTHLIQISFTLAQYSTALMTVFIDSFLLDIITYRRRQISGHLPRVLGREIGGSTLNMFAFLCVFRIHVHTSLHWRQRSKFYCIFTYY